MQSFLRYCIYNKATCFFLFFRNHYGKVRYKRVGNDLENGIKVTKVNWVLIISSICLCIKYELNPSHLSFKCCLNKRMHAMSRSQCCWSDLENWNKVTKIIWHLDLSNVDLDTKYDKDMLFCFPNITSKAVQDQLVCGDLENLLKVTKLN